MSLFSKPFKKWKDLKAGDSVGLAYRSGNSSNIIQQTFNEAKPFCVSVIRTFQHGKYYYVVTPSGTFYVPHPDCPVQVCQQQTLEASEENPWRNPGSNRQSMIE